MFWIQELELEPKLGLKMRPRSRTGIDFRIGTRIFEKKLIWVVANLFEILSISHGGRGGKNNNKKKKKKKKKEEANFWGDNLNINIHPLLLGFLTGINVGWMDEFHGQHCYHDEPLGLWGPQKKKKQNKNKKQKTFNLFF
jgi:hypothetical protein